jgi:sec-independent protein translocase protein TatA
MGVFGLGAPEIAIILIAAGFLIGPQQLGNMVGKLKNDMDDIPDDLKKIPESFQKGFEEGEVNAKSRRAKPMEKIPAALEEKE